MSSDQEGISRERFGFYDRLKAEFPSQILVDATEVCNLACDHCPHPMFKHSEHYAGRHLAPELNRKMVEEVRSFGQGSTQYIRYTSNGEPLAHPRIYDLLDDAVRHSGVLVTLTTNGTILNEKRVEKLLASGLHLVDISIDAFTPETYARIRVNGNLEVTRRNVLRLLEIKQQAGASTKIVVSFVQQPDNLGETDDFESYWKDQGVDYVVIRRLHSNAGNSQAIADLLHAGQMGVPRYPCLYPWERILLNARGDLAFCPQDWVHGSFVADYRATTIREVWQGEFYRKLREAHLTGNFCDHQFCGQCPDWQQTRWPGAGRSYADMVQDVSRAEKES